MLSGIWQGALEYLAPRKCALCGLISDDCPCPQCTGEFVPTQPISSFEEAGPLAFRASLFLYEGRAAQAVRRLKYARSTSLVSSMAEEIAQGVERLAFTGIVVPVPIHWTRLYSRGFNQAELLCERLPYRKDLLRRVRATKPQVGLNREQRLRNLKGAFAASPEVRGNDVLLIDDVVTSGQTARECALALKEQGAREVSILAFCGEAGWD